MAHSYTRQFCGTRLGQCIDRLRPCLFIQYKSCRPRPLSWRSEFYDPIAEGWLGAVDKVRTIIWDRQGWLSRARDSGAIAAMPLERKIYLANESEAMEDTDQSGMDATLLMLPPPGFDIAVIKGGAKGVTVVEGSSGLTNIEQVPAFPVQTSSSIGSGDVFAGVFAARLALGQTPTEATHWACAAAAIALQSGSNRLGDDAADAVRRLLTLS